MEVQYSDASARFSKQLMLQNKSVVRLWIFTIVASAGRVPGRLARASAIHRSILDFRNIGPTVSR